MCYITRMSKVITLRDANQSFARRIRDVEGGESFGWGPSAGLHALPACQRVPAVQRHTRASSAIGNDAFHVVEAEPDSF
jgi:hypothetical protein